MRTRIDIIKLFSVNRIKSITTHTLYTPYAPYTLSSTITSWYGNAFCSSGRRWFPLTKDQLCNYVHLWYFFGTRTTSWTTTRLADDLRRHTAMSLHCNVPKHDPWRSTALENDTRFCKIYHTIVCDTVCHGNYAYALSCVVVWSWVSMFLHCHYVGAGEEVPEVMGNCTMRIFIEMCNEKNTKTKQKTQRIRLHIYGIYFRCVRKCSVIHFCNKW